MLADYYDVRCGSTSTFIILKKEKLIENPCKFLDEKYVHTNLWNQENLQRIWYNTPYAQCTVAQAVGII